MKKKYKILFFFCLFIKNLSKAEEAPKSVSIPSKIRFADIQLIITKDAKPEIQRKIDVLIKDNKSFLILLKRIRLYIPIVEKILLEEGLPLDFKYTPIQESALIQDADDSYSLGFWQFKQCSAKDASLLMDNHVDERVHIVESTRGAARFLKSHNSFFQNWFISLLAYNRGRSWTEKQGHKKYANCKKIIVDKNTHWYLLHFLAHKIVFEPYLKKKKKHPEIYLHQHYPSEKSLESIAQKFKISHEELKKYNKWLKTEFLPENKKYSFIIPIPNKNKNVFEKFEKIKEKKSKYNFQNFNDLSKNYPKIQEESTRKKSKINNLWGTIAKEEDTIETLCQIGNIDKQKFMNYNDLSPDHKIIPGSPYYFQKKYRRPPIHFHISQQGETWWSISQKYGIRQKNMLERNREKPSSPLEKNRIIWLRFIKPKNEKYYLD